MGPFSVFWIPVRNQNKKEKKNYWDVLDCVVKRHFSLQENLGAKEGGKEKTSYAFPLFPSHGPLRFVFSNPRFSFASMRNTKHMPGSVLEVLS